MARVNSFGDSDVGLVRLNNEDVWTQLPKERCFLLADGMGGHQAGEIAASEAILHVGGKVKKAHTTSPSAEEWMTLLDSSIRDANKWVYTLSQKDTAKEGMGTTLCVALIVQKKLVYAHVGDSRIYRYRKGRLTQLTRDHSLRGDLIAKGELDEYNAPHFPLKNVITRAIGTHETVEPEIEITSIEPNDLYLLCSDGLTDPLSDDLISSTLSTSPSLQEASDHLILAAKQRGGNDNITLVLFEIIPS